jgi:hypothetical protein
MRLMQGTFNKKLKNINSATELEQDLGLLVLLS